MTKDLFIIETARMFAVQAIGQAESSPGELLTLSNEDAGRLLAAAYARSVALANALNTHFSKPDSPG